MSVEIFFKQLPSRSMNVQIARVEATGYWSWKVKEKDSCGICRHDFDDCCSSCQMPGDGCPVISGTCDHTFHMHCIEKWIGELDEGKKNCPLCRVPWEYGV